MKSNYVSTGLRLFIASFILLAVMLLGGNDMQAMMLAGIAMVFPSWKYVKGRLALGAQEAEKDALLKEISEKNKAQLDTFKTELQKLAMDSKNGMIGKEEFEKQFGELSGQLKKLDEEKFKTYEDTLAQYQKTLSENNEALKIQGTELKKLKENGVDNSAGESILRKKLKEFLNSPEYKAFADSGGKKKASFEVKAVDMTSSYTGGNRLISTRSNRIVDHPPITRLNLRDLLTVGPADLPYLAFLEVYDWVRNVGMVSENGMLPESSFKIREATADVKRIGTFVNLSKRMLKSLPFIENYLANALPAQVRYAEDFQLLYGDGVGNNPLGLSEVARDFVTEINTAFTGVAGAVTSIATYDAGTKTLVNFTANQDLVNGDTITIAGATAGAAATAYNKAHKAIVVNSRQIMIEAAYTADAGVLANWTFTVASKFKNAIAYAQEIDVLKVAKSLISRREYAATGIVIHPDDATIMETLKKTDQGYLDVQRFENGVLRIAGIPVVETTAMPSGRFLVGDFNQAAALLELTPLQLEFSESTQEKLTNTIVAIVQEEILFPVFNKYMFVFGDFTTGKAAILKP